MTLTLDPLALTAAVHTVAIQLQADAGSPGSIAYIARGSVTVTATAGVANTETGAPTQPNQAFEVGSQTKMMTAAVILQLVAENRLDLDAPAADWLAPETIAGIANAQTATLRQLLNHSSGIVDCDSVLGDSGLPVYAEQVLANPDEIFTVESFIGIVRGLPANNAPGEAFSYSNTGYLLLQKVIEQVTGQPYAEVMAERVFRPLGMEQARVDDFTPDANRWASYAQVLNGPVIDVTPLRVDSGGDGAVVATAADQVRFMQALLPSGGLVPEGLRAQQFSPFTPPGTPAASEGYGLGINIGELPGLGQSIGHSGGTLGTLTESWAAQNSGLVFGSAVNGRLPGNSGAGFEVIGTAAGTLLSTGALPDAALAPVTQLELTSGSAAGVTLKADGAGTRLALAGVTVQLDQSLAGLAIGDVNFADGSVLIVGDGTSGTAADGLGVSSDILRDAEVAADRNNQLLGLAGNDTLSGGRGADVVRGGDGDDLLDGRGGADALDGGGGSDQLIGGDGNDILYGGAGNDSMTGGEGDDQFIVGDVGDVVTEDANGGNDTAWVNVNVVYQLGPNVEIGRLFGAGFALSGGDTAEQLVANPGFSSQITGKGGDDVLWGGNAAHTLDGGAGDDTIRGQDGAVSMIGGVGNDQFVVGQVNASILELPDEGIDTAWVVVNNWTSFAHVEIVRMLAPGVVMLTGADTAEDLVANEAEASRIDARGGNDVLWGSAFADTLNGDAGDDIIRGQGGADVMAGGEGNDQYVVSDNAAIVTEGAAAGYDLVYFAGTGTFSIGDNVEEARLVADGTGLVGNALANLLVGNNAGLASLVDGAGGADTIWGTAAGDTLIGGAGNDVIYSQGGADRFLYNAADWGYDQVAGFTAGQAKIQFAVGSGVTQFSQLFLNSAGGNTQVEFNGHAILVFGMASMAQSDFIFG